VRKALLTDSSGGPVIQDYCQICESIDWQLSRIYWSNIGVAAFTSGEIPYVVTNEGSQAANAVDLFILSANAAASSGNLEPTIYVLELGVGVGLFAKLFLDFLEVKCRQLGVDYYDRTRYIVSDVSPAMLSGTRESGVLARHEERLIRLQLDASELKESLLKREPPGSHLVGSIRAIFANYLLDSLPFALLSLCGSEVWDLRMQSRVNLARKRSSDVAKVEDDLSWLFDSESEFDLERLTELRKSIIIHSAYFPIERSAYPYRESFPVERPLDAGPLPFLHSYGAMKCIEESLFILRPDGFFLAQDYGYTDNSESPEIYEFQTFGNSVASGVNFAQICRYFGDRSYIVGIPENDPESLHARLFGKATDSRVVELFRERYSGKAWEKSEEPLKKARELVGYGFFEAARWKFEEAYRIQPHNWSTLEAIATFLIYAVEEYEAAVDVVKEALQLNHLSGNLWNMLGDCYYFLEDFESAAQVYQHTLELNPFEVRGRLNLAHVCVHQEDFAGALRLIGEGLAFDHCGDFREAFLAKQSEALNGLAEDYRKDMIQRSNRLAGHHDLPGRPR
jgi:tetratricopeptide (TPR) repeat protein